MRALRSVFFFLASISAAMVAGCSSGSDGGGGATPDGVDAGPGPSDDHGDSGGIVPPNGNGNDGGDAGSSGGNHDASPDGGRENDAAGNDASDASDFVPAAHPAFPKLVKGSGNVLAHPKVVGVFFSDYTHTEQVSAMLDGLPTVKTADGVPFWSSAVGEYGVGDLTVLPPIKLTEKGPTSGLTDPASWLSGKIKNDAAFANVDANTIVAIFYPATTPLAGSCAAPGNSGYGGYHENLSTTKGNIPYAVMAECAKFGPIENALDMITIAGSHEIIEAVTDPNPNSPAYATIDTAGWPMHVLLQGNEENGDMCTINNGFIRPPSYGFLLQRGWSNKAAAAGNVDPCAPDLKPDQPFVGAFPVMHDTVSVFANGSGPGVKIPVGQSKEIEIDCFSFQPTAPFTVTVREPHAPSPAPLTLTLDKNTCVNGEKLKLTVTVNSAGTSGYQAFLVQAHVNGATDAQAPAWAGIVTQ